MASRKGSYNGNTNQEDGGGKMWERYRHPYANEHAPSNWKKEERRIERTKARQAIREGREPSKYHRPYYW